MNSRVNVYVGNVCFHLNPVLLFFSAVLSVWVRFSQKKSCSVWFECTTFSEDDSLTLSCVCVCMFQGVVHGRCLESETGLRGWKREGLQCCVLWVQCYCAAYRAVPPSPVSRKPRWLKTGSLSDALHLKRKKNVSICIHSVTVFILRITVSIYAQLMNSFTLVFPNTWCRINLAKDKIFWLTGGTCLAAAPAGFFFCFFQ